ncbi:hypothetical protein C2W58_01536 [Bacillus pumilus]|uniref:Uncharacterized protein n=1 Tax=Bacillus pumilus TaxID=1408 RepID=A0AB34QVY0_BACPU|nr:hypothetical protein B4127_3658 [Bacillus pumilus]RAP15884.1 hypothetical protein C2W58_01536 [Bacillus pumilus]
MPSTVILKSLSFCLFKWFLSSPIKKIFWNSRNYDMLFLSYLKSVSKQMRRH